jgi:hypothetical protein
MLTRDNNNKKLPEEKRDLDLENTVGNALIAEYQVDKLRTRLTELVSSNRVQMNKNKFPHMYSNTITNGISYHLE